MVSIKTLKPYYIKMNSEYICVILAYQYFSLLVNQKVYHFVPIEGQEILVNRKTKQVVNTETKFAFQKDNDIIYITMKKLTSLDDFLGKLEEILNPYFEEKDDMIAVEKQYKISEDTSELIRHLENENIKRLIDKALDNQNVEEFEQLVSLLK